MSCKKYLLIFGLFAYISAFACADKEANRGQNIAMEKCFTCHSKIIACKKIGQDKLYWENTVDRMLKKGMDITTQEEKMIINFLQKQEPDTSVLCN